MENELAALLRARFGHDHVKRQADFVDLTVQQGARRSIIEIKSATIARRAIREALGQLLDYAFFEEPEAVRELVVVGRGPLLPRDKTYLATLTKRFRLPITYRRYRLGGTFSRAQSWNERLSGGNAGERNTTGISSKHIAISACTTMLPFTRSQPMRGDPRQPGIY